MGVCVAIAWFHVEERRALARAARMLDSIHDARIDLSKGFLHVLLSSGNGSPFQREQGLALIHQSLASLRRAGPWRGTGTGISDVEARPSWIALESEMERFLTLLRAWGSAEEAAKRDIELDLRIAFHQLERLSERVELDQQREFQDLIAQWDRRFGLTVAVAAVLLAGFCFGVLLAGRNERRSAQALLASDEQLRRVGDNLPDSYVYQYAMHRDRSHRFIYVSAGVEQVHGIKTAEVLANASSVHSQVDAAQREALAIQEEESARNLSDLNVEVRIRRRDGAERLVHVRSRPRQDADGGILWDGCVTDITDRKRAEEEVRRSEQLFRTLVETAPDAIWVLLENRFVYLNASALRLFGAESAGSLLGQPIGDRIHASHREVTLQGLASLERSDAAVVSKDRILLALDGMPRHADLSQVRILYQNQESILVFGRDVGDRRLAEAAVEQQLKLKFQLERIAATVPGTIYSFVLRPDGSMAMPYASAEVESVFGLKPEDIRDDASAILALVHPADIQRVRESIAASATTLKPWREEFRAQNTKRGDIWIEGHSMPQRQPDGSILWHGFLQDITERRQLEHQFRQAQKMEAIGQLAGGVAHDFNNILAAIMMQAELGALVHGIPAEVLEGLQQIQLAAKRGANLTRQLLLFGRRQVMQPRDLDVNAVVKGLANMLRRIIGEDVRLQLELHLLPLTTHADAGMLEQVLMNLAVNSRDAVGDKGGMLLIKTSERTVDVVSESQVLEAPPGRYVCITVEDNGCGIPSENLPRIFEPFFTTKQPGRGTGLGLATVFGIVKHHRGTIRVESEPGRGTTVKVLLPACDRPVGEPQVLEEKPDRRWGSETILLAEDDLALRAVTRKTLERHGYRILEAGHGFEALERWKQHQGKVSLLLTDLVMPSGMTGQELAKRLREEQPDLKVIFTSGYSSEMAGREVELRQGEEFVQKPCPPDLLLSVVRRCLDA